MNDREYDTAKLEIEMNNDELMREWLLHKLGRRAEVLSNANQGRITAEIEGAAGQIAPPASR